MSGLGSVMTGAFAAGGVLVAEGASDGPSDGQDLNAVTVSPGLPGFVVMFLIAVALVLLILDMSRRVRRITARQRIEERHRLEELEDLEEDRRAELADGGGADGSGRDAGPGGDGRPVADHGPGADGRSEERGPSEDHGGSADGHDAGDRDQGPADGSSPVR